MSELTRKIILAGVPVHAPSSAAAGQAPDALILKLEGSGFFGSSSPDGRDVITGGPPALARGGPRPLRASASTEERLAVSPEL